MFSNKHQLKVTLALLLFFLVCGVSCSEDRTAAEKIIDQAIAAHGGEQYKKGVVSFRLRDRQYRALRDGGAFAYSRTFIDSTGQRVYDVLQNSGFTRTVNDVEVSLPEEEVKAYTASVNAVIYFALLPYALNDAAVRKRYLGETTVKGEPYHKIEVTFEQEVDGDEHNDVYVYWIHQEKHTMDYLAYAFEENGGGTRFREAVNPRTVGGIRFQDYMNYTTKDQFPLERYDEAFEAGQLEKVSEVNLEELSVSGLPNG